ncbi:MAG: hypothetical protein SOT37_01515 [Oscillospiraceae bacterium]|nr:hypothetical protein [Oscillospiraceae bacterium]
MKLPNMDIRNYAREKGVFLWRVADKLGMHEATLSRKLRHLTDEERAELFAVIEELSREAI